MVRDGRDGWDGVALLYHAAASDGGDGGDI